MAFIGSLRIQAVRRRQAYLEGLSRDIARCLAHSLGAENGPQRVEAGLLVGVGFPAGGVRLPAGSPRPA